jgi:hypothetical protein
VSRAGDENGRPGATWRVSGPVADLVPLRVSMTSGSSSPARIGPPEPVRLTVLHGERADPRLAIAASIGAEVPALCPAAPVAVARCPEPSCFVHDREACAFGALNPAACARYLGAPADAPRIEALDFSDERTPVADLTTPRVRLAMALDAAGLELESFARECAGESEHLAQGQGERLRGFSVWSSVLLDVHWTGQAPPVPTFWLVVERVARRAR